MKGIAYFRNAIDTGVSLSPEFVRQVLGEPKCTVEQAAYSAQALEQDRLDTRREYWNRILDRADTDEDRAYAIEQLVEIDSQAALRVLETNT